MEMIETDTADNKQEEDKNTTKTTGRNSQIAFCRASLIHIYTCPILSHWYEWNIYIDEFLVHTHLTNRSRTNTACKFAYIYIYTNGIGKFTSDTNGSYIYIDKPYKVIAKYMN